MSLFQIEVIFKYSTFIASYAAVNTLGLKKPNPDWGSGSHYTEHKAVHGRDNPPESTAPGASQGK